MASTQTFNSRINHFCDFKSPIIDIRGSADFAKGHWIDASHFPLPNLIDRLFELPKRNQPLRLCGELNDLIVAKNSLREKGYQIDATIGWDRELENYLASVNLLSTGYHSTRLWSPAPAVKSFLKLYQASGKQNQSGQVDKPKALDIGCGSGRDAVYLAMQGWQVDAIDYSAGALKKANLLAQNHQIQINTLQIDIERTPEIFHSMENDYQLILVVRYLHRPILSAIKQKIAPGGFIVYQTFMRGCEIFGSPKNPRFLLEKGELASRFSDFEILLDEIFYLEDGRPTNLFIAQNTKFCGAIDKTS